MNQPGGPTDKQRVPALVRGFAVLDLIAREPGLDFTAIHRRLELPKSSTHQLLATLVGLGAIRPLPNGGYTLGLRMLELGEHTSRSHGLIEQARPHLSALAHKVQLTCHLGVLDGHEAVYLARVECQQEIRVNSWVGKRFSLQRSALGKVLLAWLPEAEREAIISRMVFEAKMPKSLPDSASYRAHLEGVRQRGWAVDDEEDVPNIRCIALPIHARDGRVVAAVSTVGTSIHIDENRFRQLAPVIAEVAAAIERDAFGVSAGAGEVSHQKRS